MEELDKHSRLLWWSVENFMCIAQARVEFDDTNIINFKGFNDSGKSAMLRALEVILSNKYPTEQAKFIKDGESYFRIMVGFSDGVVLLRDKYISGQSLYAMYKDNKEIFTTKQNGKYIKVTEVPDVIKQYVDFVEYDGIYLNSRSCFDPQLLVQTSGSKNYRLFNSVLHSEELAQANQLLNTDKNTLIASRNSKEMEVEVLKNQASSIPDLTEDVITGLEILDKSLDKAEEASTMLSTTLDYHSRLDAIVIPPELSALDTSQLDTMVALANLRLSMKKLKDISLPEGFAPIEGTEQLSDVAHLQEVQGNITALEEELSTTSLELTEIQGTEQLRDIKKLSASCEKLSYVDSYSDTIPELEAVDEERLKAIRVLSSQAHSYNKVQEEYLALESKLKGFEDELQGIMKTLSANNIKTVTCKNCGQLMLV